MKGRSLTLLLLAMLLLEACGVLLGYARSGRLWVAAVVGLILSVACALVLRLLLTAEAKRLVRHVVDLPESPGAVRARYGELEDVDHALAEAALRMQRRLEAAGDERRQLEALLDSMQDAVVAVDAAGRIAWTNVRMQRLIPGGGGPGAHGAGAVRVGQALVQTVRDPEVLACVKHALEEGGVCVRRSTSLLAGRIFEVNASPMPGGGAVAVLHDVTRMEEVERTQREFVANVSHELRTPLTSITGYVETVLDHEATLSAQGREFLGTILKNATRMNRLTEDLLVMATVEAPAMEMKPVPVAADTLVRDAVEAMRTLVQENAAEIEVGAVCATQVFADADAVLQVLGNLIENALKYGKPRGEGRAVVVLAAREVDEPFAAVEFSVRDFGGGIASEHLPRLFERFYRVDKTRSRESGGTGLGLSIARHMVQMQGGEIWAESELGVGSTFFFTLPKALYPA